MLDNAPTYLTFLSVAQSLVAANPGEYNDIITIASGPVPESMLAAVSLGAVFLGAMTYIGNGPNFMIKAIAQEWGYRMADFFSYTIKYALPVLLPIYIFISLHFFTQPVWSEVLEFYIEDE